MATISTIMATMATNMMTRKMTYGLRLRIIPSLLSFQCLDALYGVMMLRLQKKEITPETERAIKEITVFIPRTRSG